MLSPLLKWRGSRPVARDTFITISIIFVIADGGTVRWRWGLFIVSYSCIVTKDPVSMLWVQ